MTTENINIILTNAVCCISKQATKVSNLLSIGDKCAESELIKLKLLNDYVETLRCYKNEKINSEFLLKLDSADYNTVFLDISNILRTYRVTINGIAHTMQGDGVSTKGEIWEEILNGFDSIISYYSYTDNTKGRSSVYTFISTTCDIQSISFDTTISESVLNIPIITPGVCSIKNCLSEEDIQIIINKIMTICDICDCQLSK